MAQFLLLLHNDPKPWVAMPPEERQKWYAKYGAWREQAKQAGYYVGGQKLVDDAGKILRGPKAPVDGPYSETKEVLGGFFLIEANSYDEAVRRCKGHPHLEHGGTIEVRQIDVLTGPGANK